MQGAAEHSLCQESLKDLFVYQSMLEKSDPLTQAAISKQVPPYVAFTEVNS
jgi:hypothetical protein